MPWLENANASVFDAIADAPQEPLDFRLRAEAMQRLAQPIERKARIQGEAAELLASPRRARRRAALQGHSADHPES